MRSFHWTLNWGKVANHMLSHLLGHASSPGNGRFGRKKDLVSIIILWYPKNAWKSMHTALPRGQHLEVLWAQYAKNFLLKINKQKSRHPIFSQVFHDSNDECIWKTTALKSWHQAMVQRLIKNIIKHRQQRLQHPFLPHTLLNRLSGFSPNPHLGKKQCFPQLRSHSS